MKCRNCSAQLAVTMADLGTMPLSNAMLAKEQLAKPELLYPLRVLVCEHCWLVQTEDFTRADEVFDDSYTYFSSYSQSWLDHGSRYTAMITERLRLNEQSLVIEIASNDGYLLRHFAERKIPALGIEPTANTARAAQEMGIETVVDFFGKRLARELAADHKHADLIVGNNVLAHVPNINDFVGGLPVVLKPNGVVTMEFPHLTQLIEHCQFDTIYHEHFSYLSLTVVNSIFSNHELQVFDVEELPTHGGSLRIYASHPGSFEVKRSVNQLLDHESRLGIATAAYYSGFQERMQSIGNAFSAFVNQVNQDQETIIGYGAAAKGNTFLNFCKIDEGMMAFVADASPHKQHKYLPGTHLHVQPPEMIRQEQPKFVVILPWNLREEIMSQLSYIREWDGKFVVGIPELQVL